LNCQPEIVKNRLLILAVISHMVLCEDSRWDALPVSQAHFRIASATGCTNGIIKLPEAVNRGELPQRVLLLPTWVPGGTLAPPPRLARAVGWNGDKGQLF
jgi:hypothetical protein